MKILYLLLILVTALVTAQEKCISFTTGNYVRIPTNVKFQNLSSFTLEFWVYINSHQEEQIIGTELQPYGWSYSPGGGLLAGTTTGVWGPSTYWQQVSIHPNNVWYHIAMVYDAGLSQNQFKLFFNGTKFYEETKIVGIIGENQDVCINRHIWDGGSSSRLTGKIDEVRISNLARYSSNFTPSTTAFPTDTNTLALYHFNEGSGSTIIDASGNGINGNIAGSMTWSNDTPMQTNLQTGLIAYYPFNGNANDESGSNYHGTVNGATLVADRFSNTNKAYSFDGSNDFIQVNNQVIPSNTDFTISLWVYMRNTASTQEFLSQQSWPSGFYVGLQYNQYRVGDCWQSTGVTVVSSQWLHITVKRKYNGISDLFINGVKRASTSANLCINESATDSLRFGKQYSSTEFFNGYLDDIRIYNRSLSDAEILGLYNLESVNTPPTFQTGLVAYYPFNGNSNDESGNGNHATAYNTQNTPDRFGVSDAAFKFNGINGSTGSTVVTNNTILNIGQSQYTIHFWFKPDNMFQIGPSLINTHPHTGVGIGFNDANSPGYVHFMIGNASGTWYNHYQHGPTNNYQTGVWYSVTLTKIGTQYNFYINGQFEKTTDVPEAANFNFNVTLRMSGVLISPNVSYSFTGDMDDIRIYNRALSSAEVTELYNLESQTVSVTTPNGGEKWQVGSQHNITWTSSNVTNVKLEYTSDNGTNWINIVSSTPANAGSYQWTIPNTPSPQCKVKISAVENPEISDVGDTLFTISYLSNQTITITNNASESKQLEYGLHPNATDGIDVTLGEISLPPVPPSSVCDVRFELPVTPVEYSIKDFRIDTLSSATWVIRIQSGDGGYPVTLTWDMNQLPEGTFILKDAVTGTIVNVNMKVQGNCIVTNSAINTLKIEYSKSICKQINISSGWNIVSVPVEAADMRKLTLFTNATSSMFTYSNGYQAKDTAELGKGYWIRYGSNAVVDVCGSQSGVTTLPVKSGWNMIGVYDKAVVVSGITTTPANILTSNFFGYNSGYIIPITLESGKGYWIRASQNGVINLNSTLLAKGSETSLINNRWSSLILTDREGKISTLYLSEGKENLSSYDLPPVPPEGVFDVRFATDRMVEDLTSSKEIKINSANYPVTIKSDAEVKVKVEKGNIISEKILKEGETIHIGEGSRIFIERVKIPAEFGLSQNYPNPFNPSTIIRYQLPVDSKVSLKLYDVLGNEIATLVDQEEKAGKYEVTFEASKLASGVYFYELKAGEFRSVKKLVLMK